MFRQPPTWEWGSRDPVSAHWLPTQRSCPQPGWLLTQCSCPRPCWLLTQCSCPRPCWLLTQHSCPRPCWLLTQRSCPWPCWLLTQHSCPRPCWLRGFPRMWQRFNTQNCYGDFYKMILEQVLNISLWEWKMVAVPHSFINWSTKSKLSFLLYMFRDSCTETESRLPKVAHRVQALR